MKIRPLLHLSSFLLAVLSPGHAGETGRFAAEIAAALPDKPYASPAKPRRVLLFTKTNGYRHGSIPTGVKFFTELGRKTGAFEVTHSEDLAQLEPESLAALDAVCFLNTSGDIFLPHPKERATMSADRLAEAQRRADRLKAGLMEFVKSGKGFIGVHAATDCCNEWPEYGTMINGYFDGHPWTADTDVSIRVEPGQEAHPLVAMFEGRNLDIKEEIYQLRDPYDSRKVHMLLRLDTDKTDMTKKGIKRTDKDFGISWARHWGKGRVFYCALGHNDWIYWNPKIVRHYLAGTQWALGDLKAEVRSADPE
jgi:type 1 glutamine amidotransferase